MDNNKENMVLLSAGWNEKDIEKRFYYRAYQEFTYKKTPEADLKISVHYPHDWKRGDRRPGILFFFGGGFRIGTRFQYARHCEYFASRGMVAATADYRLIDKHGTGLHECYEDGFSAMRWFRSHADDLGIDRESIAAGGGSAGGAVAAALATMSGFDTVGEDTEISAMPNAMVLFNPAFMVSLRKDPSRNSEEKKLWLKDVKSLKLTEDNAPRYVIMDNLHADLPPTYLWFGTKDRLLAPGKVFMEKAKSFGVPVDLQIAEGADHGESNDYEHLFCSAIRRIDSFLVANGLLEKQR